MVSAGFAVAGSSPVRHGDLLPANTCPSRCAPACPRLVQAQADALSWTVGRQSAIGQMCSELAPGDCVLVPEALGHPGLHLSSLALQAPGLLCSPGLCQVCCMALRCSAHRLATWPQVLYYSEAVTSVNNERNVQLYKALARTGAGAVTPIIQDQAEVMRTIFPRSYSQVKRHNRG